MGALAIFAIESVALCAVFTALIVPSVLRDPLAHIHDYPPRIRQRARELGLVTDEDRLTSPRTLVRKALGAVLAVALLAALVINANGARTFADAFLTSYGLWLVIDWYDALVLDCLWFCHEPRVVIPGTEDMVDTYHDYLFQIRMSVIGMLIGLPVCASVGLVAAIV